MMFYHLNRLRNPEDKDPLHKSNARDILLLSLQ